MGGFIQNIPGVSTSDSGYTPAGLSEQPSSGSFWSNFVGYASDLSNLGLKIFHEVNVPTPTVPPSTLPQSSVNQSSLFGSSLSSILLIVAVVFGGIFLLKKVG